MALNDIGKVFRKSYSKLGDTCALCNKEIPEDKLILRKEDTRKIICLLCLLEIAKVE